MVPPSIARFALVAIVSAILMPVAVFADDPSPTPTDNPSPTPTDAPSPTLTDVPSPTPTDVPSPTPTDVPSPTPTDMPSPTPTDVPSPTANPCRPPVVELTSSRNPSVVGQQVTFTFFQCGCPFAYEELMAFGVDSGPYPDGSWYPPQSRQSAPGGGGYYYYSFTFTSAGLHSIKATYGWTLGGIGPGPCIGMDQELTQVVQATAQQPPAAGPPAAAASPSPQVPETSPIPTESPSTASSASTAARTNAGPVHSGAKTAAVVGFALFVVLVGLGVAGFQYFQLGKAR